MGQDPGDIESAAPQTGFRLRPPAPSSPKESSTSIVVPLERRNLDARVHARVPRWTAATSGAGRFGIVGRRSRAVAPADPFPRLPAFPQKPRYRRAPSKRVFSIRPMLPDRAQRAMRKAPLRRRDLDPLAHLQDLPRGALGCAPTRRAASVTRRVPRRSRHCSIGRVPMASSRRFPSTNGGP